MNSKEKLARKLEEVKKNWDDNPETFSEARRNFLDVMIEKAKDGYYSDYDSPLAMPCVQLVRDLESIEAFDVALLAKSGEFDATQEESDAWYEREGRALALEVTGGNQEIADALFGATKEEVEAKEGIKGWDI